MWFSNDMIHQFRAIGDLFHRQMGLQSDGINRRYSISRRTCDVILRQFLMAIVGDQWNNIRSELFEDHWFSDKI